MGDEHACSAGAPGAWEGLLGRPATQGNPARGGGVQLLAEPLSGWPCCSVNDLRADSSLFAPRWVGFRVVPLQLRECVHTWGCASGFPSFRWKDCSHVPV